jgi:hypothetical protein
MWLSELPEMKSLAGFEIVTVVDMNRSVFCEITLHSPLKVNRYFGGIYRFQLHCRRINNARNKRETGRKQNHLFLQRRHLQKFYFVMLISFMNILIVSHLGKQVT